MLPAVNVCSASDSRRTLSATPSWPTNDHHIHSPLFRERATYQVVGFWRPVSLIGLENCLMAGGVDLRGRIKRQSVEASC